MTEMNSAARAAIFSRIRAANSTADPAARATDYQNLSRGYQQAAGMDRTAIIRTFAERLREYDASVYEATPAMVCEVIVRALGVYGGQSVAAAKDFPSDWLSEDLSWKMEAGTGVEDLDKAECAVAMCKVAIAHTGTIVLSGSRRLSLLPDRLLCVVRERQIVETVPEAITRLQPFAADALTFISGPSATSDIEMTRIRGVHGPRILDVIIVRD